jgi:hypothetical protein
MRDWYRRSRRAGPWEEQGTGLERGQERRDWTLGSRKTGL